MDNPILLSIVIPTRNRFDYVIRSMSSILENIPDAGLQLVVEDNSTSDQLARWVAEQPGDPRLVYRYSPAPVSMTENYERATAQASGEYVCLIGDDDSVNPEIFRAAGMARAEKIDALVFINPANYVWPDLKMPAKGAIGPGELRIRPFSGQVQTFDPAAEMLKVMRSAGQSFHGLPKVYYGLVRRSLLEQVRQATGCYFPGVSPDLASALAVANFCSRVVQVDYPIFLPGSSANSNAGLSGLKKHIGRLRDQPHLPADTEARWSELVPLFYSVETVWAESAVSAVRALGRGDLLRQFNVARLYAALVMWHPEYMQNAPAGFRRGVRGAGQRLPREALRFLYYYGSIWGLRAQSLLRRVLRRPASQTTGFESLHGLVDIHAAVDALSAYLDMHGEALPAQLLSTEPLPGDGFDNQVFRA